MMSRTLFNFENILFLSIIELYNSFEQKIAVFKIGIIEELKIIILKIIFK